MGVLRVKSGGTWVDIPTVGPQGPQGPQGVPGSGGADTPAQILAKLVTVDGAGSALDADLLDGQHGAYYSAWGNLTGKPTTFPPALPILESDVTNLVADLAKKIEDAPSDSKQYVRQNAAWAVSLGNSGGSMQEFSFSSAISAPPGSNQIRLNNVTQASATLMWVHYQSSQGIDVKNFLLANVKKGSVVYMQDKNNAAQWVQYDVTADATDSGTYGIIPVAWRASDLPLAGGQLIIIRLTFGQGLGEAPTDGQQYGRQSSGWTVVTPNPTWATLSGKPATFPPTLPILESDVTNLVTDLAAKQPLITAGTTAQYYRGDKTFQTLDKTAVGLANVDNTSDANKPVSTAQQTALNLKEDKANKGAANGYAPLDASTKIAATYLPAYVDDVLEYANLAAFPGTGTTGIIYVALDTNKVYRWSGSAYTEISPSPGSTDAVPEGSVNLYYTNARASAAAPVQSVSGRTGAVTLTKTDVGLANVDNTSDINKPVSTAQQTALNGKENTITAGTTAQYYRGDKSWQTLDKTAVGLSNVDNTSDINKPVSTAQAAAIEIAKVTVSDTAPATPADGSLWWESDTGLLFISFNDGNSTQWVQIAAANGL